jgi:MoxR-like ATPase
VDSDLKDIATHVRLALAEASRGLIEREVAVELIGLAAVAGEHLLLIGPPGTGKSEAVRRVARALQGKYFEYLLGRFTEPMELFGPVDLRRLREGSVVTDTTGMLPEAEVAFLDEIFLGSTAILNTLLGLLNERRFRRGHTDLKCPLRVAVGASNALPDDVSLAAFADRFLIRVFVEAISEPRLEELLAGGWSLGQRSEQPRATVAEVDALAQAARQVDLDGVRPHLAHALRRLRRAGIALSDRRAVNVQKLIAAAAVLDGRRSASLADLWPVIYALPTADEQSAGRSELAELLQASRNEALVAAAAEASLGPLARAERIVALAGEVLAAEPEAPGAAREPWLLRLEAVVREIDAGFSPESLPDRLRPVRETIAAILGAEGWQAAGSA